MRTFEIEDKHFDEAFAHECEYQINSGPIGGRLTFEFTPTSLGVIVGASCACGKKFDFTDYTGF